MKLLKQPDAHSCVLYSFAMALDVDPEWLIHRIGHDGSANIGGTKPRGFHIQELIEVVLHLDKTCTPIQVRPVSRIPGRDDFEITELPIERFLNRLAWNQGVLEGRGRRHGHMCAWDGKYVFDPNGSCYRLWECDEHSFSISCFWMIK